MELQGLARLLIVAGVLIVVAGVVLLLFGRIPLLGRLPGDFTFRWGNATVYIPLATMLLLSIVLSAVLSLVGRWFR